jgi:hypothetical protein
MKGFAIYMDKEYPAELRLGSVAVLGGALFLVGVCL